MASLQQPGVTLPPIPPNIASIVGPVYLGDIVNWFFYGIIVMQTYTYYQSFPNDSKKIKTLVYGLFLLDSLQTIMAAPDSFTLFATGFGNMNVLKDPRLSGFYAPILDGIIAFIVQTFFCYRIKILQKSWWLPLTIFCISIAGFVGAMAVGIKTFQSGDLTKLGTFKWEFSLWLASSALSDTVIAIVMTYVLLSSRSEYFHQTNDILVKVVRLTVETNIATASLAILCLVVLLAIPQDPTMTTTPGFALGKVYTNTFVAILNNRVHMNRGIAPVTSSVDFRRPGQTREGSTQLERQLSEPYRFEVQVHQQMEAKSLSA